MKIRHLFSLAVLALLAAACGSEEIAQPQPVPGVVKIPFSAVISTDAAGTRSLKEDEGIERLKAEWKIGNQVALIHRNTVDLLTVTSVNNNNWNYATIEGEVTSPYEGDAVFVVYTGGKNMESLQQELESKNNDLSDRDITNYMKKLVENTQTGTLSDISERLDYNYNVGGFKLQGNKVSFAYPISLVPQFAIWKILPTGDLSSFENPGTLDIQGKDLSIAMAYEPSDSLYIVIPPGEYATLNFQVSANQNDYSCTLNDITLEAGRFYVSTLTFSLPEPEKQDGEIAFAKDADTLTWSATAADNTYQLKADVTGDAIPTYSLSDNTCGAEINALTGVVTFTKAGSVKVTATVEDTDAYTYAAKSVSYTLTVSKAAGSISYATATVEKQVTDAAFTNNTLTVVGDGTGTYTSDTESVATVDENGLVTIKGVGEATITATVADSDTYTYAEKTAKYTVNVKASPSAISNPGGYADGGDPRSTSN